MSELERLTDTDYAILDAARVRWEQDRRHAAIKADIAAQNARAWEAHLASALVASAHPSADPLDPEPADEPETVGSLLTCIREAVILAGTLLIRAMFPKWGAR